VHALLPHLAERCELTLLVEHAGGELAGCPLQSVTQLDPTAFDQVVYAVGNEAAHGYMLPIVRRIGGVAALFDWCLAKAARAAYPGFEVGGALAGWLALREGGREGLRLRDDADAVPALNRSIVRHADGFLLPTEELRTRVLEDRNGPTPTAVFDPAAATVDVARLWADALEAFPPHRAARKSILRSIVDAARGV